MTLPQAEKLLELDKLGWKSVEQPTPTGVDPIDLPIGGPLRMKAPNGKVYTITSSGEVVLESVSPKE